MRKEFISQKREISLFRTPLIPPWRHVKMLNTFSLRHFKLFDVLQLVLVLSCSKYFTYLPWLSVLNIQLKATDGGNELCSFDNVSKQGTNRWDQDTVWSKPFKCRDCSAVQVSENWDLVVGGGRGSLVMNQKHATRTWLVDTWVRFWIQSSYWL